MLKPFVTGMYVVAAGLFAYALYLPPHDGVWRVLDAVLAVSCAVALREAYRTAAETN